MRAMAALPWVLKDSDSGVVGEGDVDLGGLAPAAVLLLLLLLLPLVDALAGGVLPLSFS